MWLDAESEIGGFPALTVRDFLSKEGRRFNKETVMNTLGIPADKAEHLISHLAEHGLIVPRGQLRGVQMWQRTAEGGELAAAKANKPIFRATAERHLVMFLQRVRALICHPDSTVTVDRLVVTGDLLTDAEKLFEIEIGIRLARRPAGKVPKRFCAAEAATAEVPPTIETEDEALHFLKHHSHYLTIHLLQGRGPIAGQHVVFFERGVAQPDAMDTLRAAWTQSRSKLTDKVRKKLSGELVRRIQSGQPPDWKTITRDELEVLVWTLPAKELAEIFGIRERTIAKKCYRLGIEKPTASYWIRVHNRKIPIPKGAPAQTFPKPAAGKAKGQQAATTPETDWTTISKSELEKLVWDKAATTLAAQFGISDVAIVKKCKRLGIIKPPRGFWERVYAGILPHPHGVVPEAYRTPKPSPYRRGWKR